MTDKPREARQGVYAAFLKANPKATLPGAQIDSQISTLQSQTQTLSGDVNKVEADVVALTARVAALEQGTEPPPIDPPDPGGGPDPGPGDKRFPDYNDPMCGVPSGTSLTTVGATTISENGAKISGKKFTGRVTVTGSDVEIFNCEIYHGDWWALDGQKSKNLNIHHCYIHSDATSGNSGVNTGTNTKLSYCRFRGFENAVNVGANNLVLEWNDACKLKGGSESHYDTLQCDGANNVTIKHNRFVCEYGQTSACMIDNYWGGTDNVLCEDNYFEGGGYTVYLDGSFHGAQNTTNVRYINNVMKQGGWGYIYWNTPGPGCTHSGNVNEHGQPID